LNIKTPSPGRATYGGTWYGSSLVCKAGYVKSANTCMDTPAHSNAYGTEDFFCHAGYYKKGNSCESVEAQAITIESLQRQIASLHSVIASLQRQLAATK
jgi:hypothetical protein